MKMSVIFLLIVLSGFTAGLVREYFFLYTKMNWTNAQQHCRQHYKDLATITTAEENKILRDTAGENPPDAWIGLYRSPLNSGHWLWSDGKANSFSWWELGQPNNLNEGCVLMEKDGWNDYLCWAKMPFFCEKILVLVKENKTWEEAYEHCRFHHTGLAFLTSDTMHLAKNEIHKTQTVSVWTGLRFLAGEWFWVNGEPLGSLVSLPSCPAPPYRCGAINSMTDVWENRDCEEKLNFLCY